MTTPTDSQEFKSLLGCFATGVTVATTLDADGERSGMTASAVAAVSVDPPLLLLCVDRDAKFHDAVEAGRGFALNVLAFNQERISRVFAESCGDPFSEAEFRNEGGGYPLLEGAVAHIVCALWGSHKAGDHTVFFGTVTRGEVFDRPPLLHYRSRYTTVKSDGQTDGQSDSN